MQAQPRCCCRGRFPPTAAFMAGDGPDGLLLELEEAPPPAMAGADRVARGGWGCRDPVPADPEIQKGEEYDGEHERQGAGRRDRAGGGRRPGSALSRSRAGCGGWGRCQPRLCRAGSGRAPGGSASVAAGVDRGPCPRWKEIRGGEDEAKNNRPGAGSRREAVARASNSAGFRAGVPFCARATVAPRLHRAPRRLVAPGTITIRFSLVVLPAAAAGDRRGDRMKRGKYCRGAGRRSRVEECSCSGRSPACAAGFGALCTIPELPRWGRSCSQPRPVGCLGLALPARWA